MNILQSFLLLAMAFLVLSPNVAFASLEGDEILVTLETSGEQFLGPPQTITVPGSAVFTDGCSTHEVMVEANGEVWIILMSTGSCALNLPFTIWIEDIDWVDQPGQVEGFTITDAGPFNPTVTTTPTSVHVEFPPGSPISQQAASFHLTIETTHQDRVIGGEIFTIDTSSLLLAGVQTNLAWIIPVVLSAAGIGVFFVKRK